MQGLDLCERFYHDQVAPLVALRFPQLQGQHAAGLIGYGSDVLGYDDDLSRDHEWGPRCHLWLTAHDYGRYARRLDQMLSAELPREFQGFPTRYVVAPAIQCLVPAAPDQAGRHHIAITTVRRYLRLQFGLRDEPLSWADWLCTPEQKLLELTRGRIFADPLGEISAVRARWVYLPDEVWRYKLLYAWGSLNEVDLLGLCALRGDTLSAQIVLRRLMERLVRLIFLLNRRYCPGTMKWFSREFYTLPRLVPEVGPQLEACLLSPDMSANRLVVEEVLRSLVAEHNRLGITRAVALRPAAFVRGQASYSLQDIVQALSDSLPPDLRAQEIQGGVDQWLTNDDVLLWAEQYHKLRGLYRRRSHVQRDGVGDMIV